MDFLKDMLPTLCDYDSNWDEVQSDDLKSTNKAVAHLLDTLKSYFDSNHKLELELKDVRTTRLLHEIDLKMKEDAELKKHEKECEGYLKNVTFELDENTSSNGRKVGNKATHA